jgi:phosphoribosylformylglycinamidine synthase
MLASAHDLADGGLAQGLVESALRHGFGARIELPDDVDHSSGCFLKAPGAWSLRSRRVLQAI